MNSVTKNKKEKYIDTISLSKDNEAARRRLTGIRRSGIRRITNMLRKQTTLPTKLAEDRKRVPQGSA